MAGVEQQRQQGMLSSLQMSDPAIDMIVAYSKFAVAYLLQQEGPNPGWRKANMEGPVYLVRRRGLPRYQLLVKNQFSTSDLLDDLHPDWELDCQKNYVFYKVEDPSKQIRGLWFHDDSERQRIEGILEKTLQEIRAAPPEPQTEPAPMPAVQQMDNNQDKGQLAPPPGVAPPAQDSITISSAQLRTALHALADDDGFVGMVMQKLKETARTG